MAVYTHVSHAELARFMTGHGLGALLSYKGIAEGVENTNYRVETDQGCFILTLYEQRVDVRDLPFYIGLMEHLASKGVACPLPVRDSVGAQVSELAGRPAAVCTFLDGKSVRAPGAEHCRQVGAALARIHRAVVDYPRSRANALGPAGWVELFDRFRTRADDVRPGLRHEIEQELSALLPLWPSGLPHGVIHADLFPDNVFFVDDRLSGIIDFYFACNDLLAYDLAICLNAWCFEADVSYAPAKGRAMIEGYCSVRELEATEVAALPLLARGAALRFLLTRAHDWLMTPKTALVAPHDPGDYQMRLDAHRGMTTAADYGWEG